LRAAGVALLCHIQVVKERASQAEAFDEEIWYPTRDSNPEQPVSETGAYSDSASGAHQNKKPGDLAAHPGSEGLPANAISLEDFLRAAGARIHLAKRDGFRLPLVTSVLQSHMLHIVPPNAALAPALTPRKQKTRSARAVRAADGRKALTRSSSPDRRLQNDSQAACSCASGRGFCSCVFALSTEILLTVIEASSKMRAVVAVNEVSFLRKTENARDQRNAAHELTR
jgi:hypothetical protein